MLSHDDRTLLQGKNFASLATTMADGAPQVSVVWIDVDRDTILVNTAEGRTTLGSRSACSTWTMPTDS